MPVILSVLAHPDDAEFLCAGTLVRLRRDHGWAVHIATMTAGDCGSAELPAEEISAVRRAEGARAAALIGATYHCLAERDLLIMYNEKTLSAVTGLLRAVRPDVVLTHSPADYLLDHEMTATVTRAAAFAAPVPNFRTVPDLRPVAHVPHLYYCDPIEGKDSLGRDVEPGVRIDVSGAMETKVAMLACHDSQRAWLLAHHGMDQYLDAMKAWGRRQGEAIGAAFAEGFRQHRGHAYPQGDILSDVLGRRE